MKNLNVGYKSQHDPDARGTYNDCGPTSIAMILNYYEGANNYTTDYVFEKTGAGKGLINFSQIGEAIEALGYNYTIEYGVSVERLKQLIDQDIPVIPLVHYGSLNSTQDKRFKGGHFFVLVGYRDDGYFVNDPNFKEEYRIHGDHHFYTKAEFEKAWNDCYLDGNPNRTIIVIHRKATNKSNGADMYPENPPHLDLNNRESMKVAVGTWVRLVKGEFVEKTEHERIVKELEEKNRELSVNEENYAEFVKHGYPTFESVEEAIKNLKEEVQKKNNEITELTKEVGNKKDLNTTLSDEIKKIEEEDSSAIGVGYEAQKQRDDILHKVDKLKVKVGLSEIATFEALDRQIDSLLKNREQIEKEAVQEYLYKRTRKLIDSFWTWLKLGFQVWRNKRGKN